MAGISDTVLYVQHWGLTTTSEALRAELLLHGIDAQVETMWNASKLEFPTAEAASDALSRLPRIAVSFSGRRRRMRVSRWRPGGRDFHGNRNMSTGEGQTYRAHHIISLFMYNID